MKPVTLLLPLLLAATPLAQAADTATLEQQAQALVKQFAGQLKPALQQAMQQGGPAHAVSVCAEKAPAIAASLSHSSGWQIKRVSLKPRNPDASPDDFERQQLQAFEQRRQQGESPAELRHSALTDDGFRYLQAQGVEPLCLACHGEQIDDKTRQVLQTRYPADSATGYRLGDIRGAFSLIKTDL